MLPPHSSGAVEVTRPTSGDGATPITPMKGASGTVISEEIACETFFTSGTKLMQSAAYGRGGVVLGG